MPNQIWDNLNRLSNEEIYERVKGGHYTEEFNAVAVEILKQRGVAVPEVENDYLPKSIPFRKSHPYLFWVIIVFICLSIKGLSTKLIEHNRAQAYLLITLTQSLT